MPAVLGVKHFYRGTYAQVFCPNTKPFPLLVINGGLIIVLIFQIDYAYQLVL